MDDGATTEDSPASSGGSTDWSDTFVRIDGRVKEIGLDDEALAIEIQSWISSIVQVEHLAMLVGNGLTTGLAHAVGVAPPDMSPADFGLPEGDKVGETAKRMAEAAHRGEANIEDQLRAAIALRDGLAVLEDERAVLWRSAVENALLDLSSAVLTAERGIGEGLTNGSGRELSDAGYLLVNLLLALANRGSSRERLHVFTTNYDRLIEHGCDLAGLRVLDRFIGQIEPVFRASRVDVDLHYNPPGIRGEPRYLEGVVRLSKLHGSLDWRAKGSALRRISLPIGGFSGDSPLAEGAGDALIIYPNAAKDIETSEYPYAELFRDFSAALCRPNSALVTYGYGFGDDHINRVIGDMLTVPSTHLLVLSYDSAEGRIQQFVERHGHPRQITVVIGDSLAGLGPLVQDLLPASAAERIAARVPSTSTNDAAAGIDDAG